jgi:hypothetical protein
MRSSSRSSPRPVKADDPRALQSPDLWAKEQPRHADRREVVALNPRLARLHEPPRMLLEEVHRFRFSLRRGFCVREEWRKPLDQAKEAVRLDIQDSDPKLEHGAALGSPRPPPGHDILERRPLQPFPQPLVLGTQRDHLQFEVLQDRAVHAGAKLRRGLPLAALVRDPAPC